MHNWQLKVLGVTALTLSITLVFASVPFLLAWFGRHFVQKQQHGSLLKKANLSFRRKGEKAQKLLARKRTRKLHTGSYDSEPEDIEKGKISRESTNGDFSSSQGASTLLYPDVMPDLSFDLFSSRSVSRDGLAKASSEDIAPHEGRQDCCEFFEQNVDAYKMLFEFIYAPAKLSFSTMGKAVLGVALQVAGITLMMTYFGLLQALNLGDKHKPSWGIGAWKPIVLEDDDVFGLYCRCFCFLMLYFMLRLEFSRNSRLMDFAWHHPASGKGFLCAVLLAVVADIVALLNMFFGAVLILHCNNPMECMMQFATLTFVVLVDKWLARPVQDTSGWAYTVPFSQLEQKWRRPSHRVFFCIKQTVHVLLVLFLFFVYIPIWSYKD